jgi:catechol 2,3-dioxygenase-like lactoylglutathione lyase family enzyme
MTKVPELELGHVGIFVEDLDRMIAFYERVMGYHVNDRGSPPAGGPEMAFMSRNPDEHHQLVFVPGRPKGVPSQIVQMSHKLKNLADLRAMHAIVASEREATDIQLRAHGIAWSMYFKDPEGNVVECFVPSPWYVHAPSAVPFDFAMSDREIFEHTRKALQQRSDFKSFEQWKKDTAARLGAA